MTFEGSRTVLICEDCLKRNLWVPSGATNVTDCDWCFDRNVLTHRYEGSIIPRESRQTNSSIKTEKGEIFFDKTQDMLDFQQQSAYHECERFEICFVNGHPKAGQVDTAASAELLKLIAIRGGEFTGPREWLKIDWVATRKRFEQAKRSYQQTEERHIAEMRTGGKHGL